MCNPIQIPRQLIEVKLQSDELLIQGCRKNDRKAQQELFLRYGKKMFAVCMRYCGNAEDAQDLLQDGFLKVFEKIGSFRGDSPLEAWMTRLFINMALSLYRKNKRGPEFVDFSDETHDMADEEVEIKGSPKIEAVLQAIQQLPDKYRLIINLYVIDKMNHREIAEQLNMTEGASKSQLSRARQMLKQIIEENTHHG